MIKRILLLFVMCVLINSIFAQNVTIKSIQKVTGISEGEFYFPKMSPIGDKVFFSQSGYTGLFSKSLIDNKIENLSTDAGAGYEFVISNDGNTAYYRTYLYKDAKKYSSLVKQNINTKISTILVSEKRELSTPQCLSNGNILFTENKAVQQISSVSEKSISKQSSISEPYIVTEDLKLFICSNGIKKEINTYPNSSYIWASISPDKTKLLFTVSDKGSNTLITDLNGNILVDFGKRVLYPKWSPDGKWISFMTNTDDGRTITSSDVWVASADGKYRTNLTNTTDKIEMYPVWGNTSDILLYNSIEGEIFQINLNISK